MYTAVLVVVVAPSGRMSQCTKPILVLDLDNTLLHTADGSTPVARPGLLPFLARVRQVYELFIFTFGTRPYAVHACKTLNIVPMFVKPKNIFSREDAPYDAGRGHLVKAFEVFLCGACAARSVAVDDSPDVWDAPTFEWVPGQEQGARLSAHEVLRIPRFFHNERGGDNDEYLDLLGDFLLQKRTVRHILAGGSTREVHLQE